MKMLVPLDMNGKKIMNTNFDLKFTDIFKIKNCYVTPPSKTRFGILTRKSDNQQVSFSNPVVLHAIIVKKDFSGGNQYAEISGGRGFDHKKIRIDLNFKTHTTMEIFETGIRFFFPWYG